MPSSSSGNGKLVKVAYAGNLVEAEMIQGLLGEQGIPSVLKQTGGNPYDLTGGGRQVLVAEETLERAREVLEGGPGTG